MDYSQKYFPYSQSHLQCKSPLFKKQNTTIIVKEQLEPIQEEDTVFSFENKNIEQNTYEVEPSAPPFDLTYYESLANFLDFSQNRCLKLNQDLKEFREIFLQIQQLLELSSLTEAAKGNYEEHMLFCESEIKRIEADLLHYI
jgi:hypothetical protein